MNTTRLLLLTLTSFSLMSSPVLATTDSIKDRAKDFKQVRPTIKEIRKEFKETVKDNRQGLKATVTQTRLDLRKKQMVLNQTSLYNNFNLRITALKEYQTNIQKRLDAKKAKFPNNQNLVEAQTKLNNLSGLYDALTKDLATYKTTVDSISNTSDITILVSTLKTQAKAVEVGIKNVRQTLVGSLQLITKINK